MKNVFRRPTTACDAMLEKVLDFEKTSMFLSDVSKNIDAKPRCIASKKTSMYFLSGHP